MSQNKEFMLVPTFKLVVAIVLVILFILFLAGIFRPNDLDQIKIMLLGLLIIHIF